MEKEELINQNPNETLLTDGKELTLELQEEIIDNPIEVPQEFRYKKEDSPLGYITDSDEIEECRRQQQLDILRNSLFGQFNEIGEYEISKEIGYELLKAKKEIIEQYKTFIFLHSVYTIPKFGQISYLVSVSKLPDNKLKARLVLLEKVDKVNGLITDTISTVISEYEDEQTPEYYDKMKEAFHIVKVDQKDIAEENPEDFKYCRMRKLELTEIWQKSKAQIERLEKNIYEEKIRTLENMQDNPFAKAILEQLKTEKDKAKVLLNNGEQYTALNSLLDSLIARNRGSMPEHEKAVMNALKDTIKNASTLQQKVVKQATNEVKTEQQKGKISKPQDNKQRDKERSKEQSHAQTPKTYTKNISLDGSKAVPGLTTGTTLAKEQAKEFEKTKNKDFQAEITTIVETQKEIKQKDIVYEANTGASNVNAETQKKSEEQKQRQQEQELIH